MGFARKRESHDASVIDNDNDNGQGAEKIETGLALTIRETRIDCYFVRLVLNKKKVAGTIF
jgi:hypothetical protein